MRKGPKGLYAWSVKIGEKGQLVVPKEAREMFDIQPGDTILLLGDVKRGLAIPVKEKFAKFAGGVFEGTEGDEE